jgi:hypothetical protein
MLANSGAWASVYSQCSARSAVSCWRRASVAGSAATAGGGSGSQVPTSVRFHFGGALAGVADF